MTKHQRGWILGYVATLLVVYLVVPARWAQPHRVALLSLLAYTLWRLRRAIGRTARPRPGWAPPGEDPGLPDEVDVRLARIQSALHYGSASHGAFDRSVRPLLAGLVAERLRRHHGIDPAADPRRARDVMGEELWQLLRTPADPEAPVPAPPVEVVERLVQRIEAI